MILNYNSDDAECLIAGLHFQQQYIGMCLDELNKAAPTHKNNEDKKKFSERTTRIDILLTKLNAKDPSTNLIEKG